MKGDAGMPQTIQSLMECYVKEIQKIYGSHLKQIILYGSYARGDYTPNSDMDIMILTTLSDSEIEQIENSIFDLAFDFQLEYSIDISVIIKNEEQFYYWLGALPFYDNVQKEGVVLNEC